MFRIETFVDDKKLSQLLHALTGIVIGTPNIQPVANGKVEKGTAKPVNSGEACEMFETYAKKHKLVEFGPSEVRAFCTASGYSQGSYSYILKKLALCKMIKKKGQGTQTRYTMVKS